MVLRLNSYQNCWFLLPFRENSDFGRYCQELDSLLLQRRLFLLLGKDETERNPDLFNQLVQI